MKHYTIYLTTVIFVLLVVFTACKKNKEDKEVSVTGVTLDKETLTLGVGEAETLIATVQPANATNKTLIWASSNSLVATILPNGLVTALSKGTATIVVSTQDGGKSASCVVIVEDVIVTGITLNKEAMELGVDSTETLIATVLPENATNKTVIWTSSNLTVATVAPDNGFVTALKVGETVITATTLENNKTARCTVKVVIPVSGITLNKNELSLAIGNSETLIATVLPNNATNKDVTWTSSNPTVATVSDNGNVIAKTSGTATITATTQSGHKTANCVLEVTDVVPVEEVKLNTNQVSLTIENPHETLIATVLPENATNKAVSWSSSNNNVASVNSNGTVYAQAKGTATITVTTEDGGKTANCTVKVEKWTSFVRFRKEANNSSYDVLGMQLLGGPDHYFGFDLGTSEYYETMPGIYKVQFNNYGGWFDCFDNPYDFKSDRKYTVGFKCPYFCDFYITDDGPVSN